MQYEIFAIKGVQMLYKNLETCTCIPCYVRSGVSVWKVHVIPYFRSSVNGFPHIVSWEPEGRYHYSKVFNWEAERRYRHKYCTAIAPFWFWVEHLRMLIAPFWLSTDDMNPSYTGWPQKNGTVDTVDFSGLCSDQQLSFSPCWIEHLFLIIKTPSSSNFVENFLFYEKFLKSSEARLMPASAAHAPTHTSIQPATKKSQCQWRAWIVNPC